MRYGTVARRNFKIRWNLRGGLVEDHHVIPREWKAHLVVKKIKYDVNSSCNLVMMPTYFGMEKLNVRRDRLVHYGGHKAYNEFVKQILDNMMHIDEHEELMKEFKDKHGYLKKNCRDNVDGIPWRS
jgi:hypothetical protein